MIETMPEADESEWEVWVDDCTVVVELPRKLALDAASSERMHEMLTAAVARPGVERVLTLLRVEHPLSAGLYDVVRNAARQAAAHGVRAWHVVAEHEAKGTALARAVSGLETAVFEDERAARAQCA